MTDLVRRALLGDRETQEECTREGIVLPCPFCGCGEAGTKWHHGYWSIKCGYEHDASPSKHCFADWGEFSSEEEALSAWNTRHAPPLVRCRECRYWVHLDESKDGYCKNPMGIDDVAQPLDFCSYGKRKEDENG